MPGKRKQQNDESLNSIGTSAPKRSRPNPLAPRRHMSDDVTSDSSTPSPTKRATYKSHPKPKATPSSLRIRPKTANRITKVPLAIPLSKSRLVPRGERRSAKIGKKDGALLRMLCDDTESGELKELHFRNMPHSSIDWNDASHINKINNWRNQIYGRAGLKSKAVTMWLPDEELWFELYFQMSIGEARVRGMLLPKTLLILDAFNETFVGRVLEDSHGNDVGPRIERKSNAFASKLNRMCPQLRARLHQSVFGKSGDIYVPKITFEMLQAYKDMKSDMGIDEESDYSHDLEEWVHLFSHLPSIDDFPVTSVEDDVAAALISMAAQSVNTQQSQNSEVSYEVPNYHTPAQFKHYRDSSTTPELFRTSFASSQESGGPLTPPCTLSFSDDDNSNKTIGYGFMAPRSVTPVRDLDIASLIVSPD